MKNCSFLKRGSEGGKSAGKCAALTVCDCENCVFFKTEEQFSEGRRAALMRILLLPAERRERILDKYYRSKKEERNEKV